MVVEVEGTLQFGWKKRKGKSKHRESDQNYGRVPSWDQAFEHLITQMINADRHDASNLIYKMMVTNSIGYLTIALNLYKYWPF